MGSHGRITALYTCVLAIGLLLFAAASVQAQGLSTLRGTVKDATQAMVLEPKSPLPKSAPMSR